jgi:hypothetical protein
LVPTGARKVSEALGDSGLTRWVFEGALMTIQKETLAEKLILNAMVGKMAEGRAPTSLPEKFNQALQNLVTVLERQPALQR